MLYLFSSTSRELYKRNVLDGCCYPEGHVLRFRYSDNFVQDLVKENPNRLLREKGLMIFADSQSKNRQATGSGPTRPSDGTVEPSEFRFYPIREVTIQNIHLTAGLLFVDAELGKFLNYEISPSNEGLWNDSIRALPEHPCPEPHSGKAFFIYWKDGPGIQYSVVEHHKQSAWRSVIDRINESSLQDCITYQISGFYYIGTWGQRVRSWLTERLAVAARAVRSDSRAGKWLADRITPPSGEIPNSITATYRSGNCIYPFKTGRSVLLKMLFYRKTEKDFKNQTLQLAWDKQVFSSVSKEQFRIQSRYNEEDVLLTCNRMSDRALATLKFVQADNPDDQSWASQPSFLVEVKPPTGYVALVLVIFGAGLLLLNTSAADLQAYAGPYLPTITSFVKPWIAFWVIRLTKPLGTLLWIGATWLFFRKFPLK
jgi:hypothetical protein